MHTVASSSLNTPISVGVRFCVRYKVYNYAANDGANVLRILTKTPNVWCVGCVVVLLHAKVTTEGKLLTVGTNSKKGLLGLGIVDGRDRSRLTEVPALKGVDVVSVACG